jgi:hypothetical protein
MRMGKHRLRHQRNARAQGTPAAAWQGCSPESGWSFRFAKPTTLAIAATAICLAAVVAGSVAAPRSPAAHESMTSVARSVNTPVSASSPVTSITGPECPDVMVVAARGSGELPQDSQDPQDDWTNPSAYTKDPDLGAGPELRDLYRKLNDDNQGLKFSLDPVMYRADNVYPHLIPGVVAGGLDIFRASVTSGATSLLADMQLTDHRCGGTVRYIIAGFSQGAWVVHDALAQMTRAQLAEVDGIALFGDPKFVPFQRIVRDYKTVDTSFGVAASIDRSANNIPPTVVSHTGSWCFPVDPVCQTLWPPFNSTWSKEAALCFPHSPLCAHFQYVSTGKTAEAAAFLDPFLPKASLWPHLTTLTKPPDGTVGNPYSWTATAAPAPSYTWSSAGSLPPRLSFSTAGVLSGTPTQAGTFTFEVKATGTYGRYASGQVTVTVNPASGDGSTTGTWTPAEAPLPANAASDASVLSLGPAACPSISVCVVAGRTTDQPELLTGSGTSWTATEAPVPADAGNPWIRDLACASASACVATGSYADSSGNSHGMLITGSGTSWTAITAPLPPDAGASKAANLWFVACASTCVATGNYVDSSGYFQGLILTGSGTSWTATAAPQPANASSLSEVNIGSVACPSATTCVAIGDYTDSSGNQQAMLITGSGTSWTATEAPLPPNATAWRPQGSGGGLAGLACASVSACVASGDYVDSSGYLQGVILTGSGTSWTATKTPLPANASTSQNIFNLDSVACASASECVATGSYRDSSGNSQVLLLTGSGTSWTATEAPLPADAASNPRAGGSAGACPSTTMCVVTSSYRDSSDNSHGVLLTGSGTSWTATEAPLPANAATEGATYAELNSVACYSASTCVATGEYVESAHNQQGLILAGNLPG